MFDRSKCAVKVFSKTNPPNVSEKEGIASLIYSNALTAMSSTPIRSNDAIAEKTALKRSCQG